MDSQTLHLVGLALGPVVVLITYVLFHDRRNPEPLGLLFACFLLGCLSVFPALGLEILLPGMLPPIGRWIGLDLTTGLAHAVVYAFVIIGFSEEYSKYLFLRFYAFPKKAFNEPYDGIVYAMMIGMGFATVENLLYIFQQDSYESGLQVAGIRALTAVPAHATFAVIMGYYAGIAKFKRFLRYFYLLTGLFLATLMHGAYDFFLLRQYFPGMWIGAVVSLVIGLRFSLRAIRLHRNVRRTAL